MSTSKLYARPDCFAAQTFFQKTCAAGSLRLVSRNEVVAAVPAARDRLRPVQNAVLERDHHLVQLAEQGHQLANAQLFRVRADGTAGDPVIARALVRLADEVHLE